MRTLWFHNENYILGHRLLVYIVKRNTKTDGTCMGAFIIDNCSHGDPLKLLSLTVTTAGHDFADEVL